MSFKKETVGDVVKLITNGVNSKQNKEGIGVKITRIETIANREINYEKTGFSKLTEAEKNKYKLIKGDILFSHINSPIHVGKSAIFDSSKDLYHGVNLLKLRVKNHISPYYFKYFLDKVFLSGYWKRTSKQSVNQASVNQRDIKKIDFLYPPLKEQQIIVAKLDAIFAEIDKMIIAEEQKRKNTIALEENLLHLLLKNIDIDKSTYTLSKLIDMGWIEGHLDGNHGGDYPRKSEFVENGVPYLSANCINDREVQINNQKYLTEERASKIRKGIAKSNDVLFAHNATVGPTAILKTDYPKVILGTSLTYYRCRKNTIHPEYLMAYMTSRYFKSQYETVMRQATRNQVPITKQRKFSFIIPDYEQQVKIAKTADAARENVKIILNSISEKTKSLNSLKSVILTKELQSNAA